MQRDPSESATSVSVPTPSLLPLPSTAYELEEDAHRALPEMPERVAAALEFPPADPPQRCFIDSCSASTVVGKSSSSFHILESIVSFIQRIEQFSTFLLHQLSAVHSHKKRHFDYCLADEFPFFFAMANFAIVPLNPE